MGVSAGAAWVSNAADRAADFIMGPPGDGAAMGGRGLGEIASGAGSVCSDACGADGANGIRDPNQTAGEASAGAKGEKGGVWGETELGKMGTGAGISIRADRRGTGVAKVDGALPIPEEQTGEELEPGGIEQGAFDAGGAGVKADKSGTSHAF